MHKQNKKAKRQLKNVHPEKESGFKIKNSSKIIQTIKNRDFIVINDFSIGGDAPKDFIKIYKYGEVRRNNPSKWMPFIAKIGHKWYPNESITEHLLNCIGKTLGLNVAHSELAIINGQLRFLSKYFLDKKTEELVHGVDVFSGFVFDKKFIEEIEEKQMAREFFTFKFACDAINFSFPNQNTQLITGFVKLLVFDAIVGNNDRHFYNWGVVKNIEIAKSPYFAPIFDTARGLFWNDSESKISEILKQKTQLNAYLKKYITKSFPKTGWEGCDNLNHIELVEKIYHSDILYAKIIDDMLHQKMEQSVLRVVNEEFRELMSTQRCYLITECLKMRFQLLRDLKTKNYVE